VTWGGMPADGPTMVARTTKRWLEILKQPSADAKFGLSSRTAPLDRLPS
jgi:hypothetical protein